MRICFFVRLFHPHIGGVEKHVYKISKNLLQRGYEVCIVTEQYKSSLPKKEVIGGITVIRIPILKNENFKKYVIWQWLWNNRELIQKADIIHCHDVFYWYLPFRFLYPSKKVYTTFHGYEGNSMPTLKAKLMHKIGEKLSYGNICVGSVLEKWYGTKATMVTYGAVDSVVAGDKVGGIDKKRPSAVFIGRLEEETGITVYLEAIRLLQKKGITLNLTVLGDGTQRKWSEEFVKRFKLPVTFKGFILDVNPYIKKTNFVFTSRYLGILEAMSHKKGVFAVYNNAIKKDYLKQTPFASWIRIAKDPIELSYQIENQLENNKALAKQIKKGYVWVKEQTWENMVEVYLKLWRRT